MTYLEPLQLPTGAGIHFKDMYLYRDIETGNVVVDMPHDDGSGNRSKRLSVMFTPMQAFIINEAAQSNAIQSHCEDLSGRDEVARSAISELKRRGYRVQRRVMGALWDSWEDG